MIKQYILTIEAPDENMIDTFVDLLNQQSKATENVSHMRIHIEED